MKPETNVAHLLRVPSVYGAALWILWLCLYWIRLISWDEPGLLANFLFAATALAFVASAVLVAARYRELPPHEARAPQRGSGKVLIALVLALHLVGLAGITKYVLDFSASLGGVDVFFLLLAEAPHRIRWESEVTSSVGTQASYAGWLAIGLTAHFVSNRRMSRWMLVPCVVQLLANLTFIDRTRPLWILFTSGLMLAPRVRSVPARKLITWALTGGLAAGAVFVGVGTWIGKISTDRPYGNTSLPPQLENVYFYGTSGFAYFNRVVEVENVHDFVPERTAYPVFKALAAVGTVPPPPNQINDFYSVPFETNVGTALEPFFRDGGLLFTLMGIVVITLGFDALALWFWRRGTALSDYAAAHLCFASFIAFFTPKLPAFPLWLFCGAALAEALLKRVYAATRA